MEFPLDIWLDITRRKRDLERRDVTRAVSAPIPRAALFRELKLQQARWAYRRLQTLYVVVSIRIEEDGYEDDVMDSAIYLEYLAYRKWLFQNPDRFMDDANLVSSERVISDLIIAFIKEDPARRMRFCDMLDKEVSPERIDTIPICNVLALKAVALRVTDWLAT